VVTDDLVSRYTLGDCGVLAHLLAQRNGWGLCVVGSFDAADLEDGVYTVDQLVHAYAPRA
jgi:hypothetical protein